ncbi:MAG: hypothetical protein DMG04_00460 [Acidobacteria bacterium]|nr:MAG: hypothetical protein DMG04_00460 [Acidobacteriota bacterium]PYQ85397.1 MAG: hypothetical protein DMG03_09015 [Acidobacteriota bacterium]PYQ87398.1 MAG: hypothetical protein DMG02_21510 [Acidobacteriota bacterium]PYR06958.1 MAG: hypothetical protein DMF99_24545 [Acidobacteriota bacterium]
MPLSRRRFLRNMSMTGAAIRVGLPPLAAMFNSSGTAYAATGVDAAVQPRFVFWFNGNGIPERYWIPREIGVDYELTPCLAPLASVRDDVHVVSGIDNPNARVTAPGNTHHKSMSALVSGTPYTGRGAGGASIDQVIAGEMRGESRFRSLQVGVCQESHGENIHRNLSWAGADRALPPEMIPHNLFDRLFGVRDQSWISRKKSVLDAVRADLASLEPSLGQADRHRLDEHLTSVREVERAIASLPSDYGKKIKEPEDVADLTDYPRIAKIQSDLVAHALASGQTRVVSYMLTKCQSLVRLPWLGYTRLRHHDYTHTNADSPEGQRTMRDICRWHVEEFAYFIGRLKSIPEGSGTLLDNTCVVFAHEHAEANPHKDNGLALILAGHAGGMKTGMHSKMRHTIGDLYLTVAEEVFKLPLEKGFPTAEKKIIGIV